MPERTSGNHPGARPWSAAPIAASSRAWPARRSRAREEPRRADPHAEVHGHEPARPEPPAGAVEERYAHEAEAVVDLPGVIDGGHDLGEVVLDEPEARDDEQRDDDEGPDDQAGEQQ